MPVLSSKISSFFRWSLISVLMLQSRMQSDSHEVPLSVGTCLARSEHPRPWE